MAGAGTCEGVMEGICTGGWDFSGSKGFLDGVGVLPSSLGWFFLRLHVAVAILIPKGRLWSRDRHNNKLS